MGKKLILLFFLLPFICLHIKAGDQVEYLSAKDTIFIKLGDYQEKIFEHTMKPKQTLYSLAKFYGLTVSELYSYNPILNEENVAVGQKIKIPIPNKAIIRFKNVDFDPSKHVPVCYIVKRRDNLFRISKVLFRMPVDTIMARNNLSNFDISIDQVLLIGWMNIEGISEKHRIFRGYPPGWKQNQNLRLAYRRASQVKKERYQSGVAYWQKDSQDNSDFFALHRYAPINSIVAVKNPMSRYTVYAKVIGRIPDTVYGRDVAVVLSPKAAKMIGAKDARFFVKVRYLK